METATNIFNDTSSPNASYQSLTVDFNDEDNDNFHLLVTDTSALDSGTDLSSDADLSFTTDIDGDSHNNTWDIGADEYPTAAAEVASSISSFFNYKQSIPPPVISNVKVEINETKAIIKWKTNKLATSEVHWSDKFYWLNRVEVNRDFKKEHSVTLDVNVEKGVKYYFKVRSSDIYNTGFDHKLYSFTIPEYKNEGAEIDEKDTDDTYGKNSVRISGINNLIVSNSDPSELGLYLSWNDFNNPSFVNDYSIYRNGSFLATTSSKYFTDLDISPLSYYSYYVVVNGKNNSRSKKSRTIGVISGGQGIDMEEIETSEIKENATENTEIDKVKELLQKQINSLASLIEKLKILLKNN